MTGSRRKRTGSAAARLCVAALLAGCSFPGSPPPAPEPPRDPLPRLTSLLAQRDQALRSLRSLARISYRVGGEKGGFSAAVLVQRPHRLRLEAFSVVGAALILTVDDGEVTGYLPSEARFYRGRASRENLYRATRMLLEPHEMAALLLGVPPVDSDAAWEADPLALRRVLPDGSADVLAFDSERTAPVRWWRTGPSGELLYLATFDDFSDTPFGRFPLTVTLETPPLQRFYEVRYDEPEVNVTLPASLFVQDLPEGVVRVPLPSPTG